MLRKILKITGVVFVILAIAATCFHFWFIHRSVGLLEDFVKEQSHGKYRLKINKLRYNYAKLIFQLEQPTLTCLDTTTIIDKYDASATRVTINLKQLLPLVFSKELRFDSLTITEPKISITHQKVKDTTAVTKELNISQDMFNAYASLQNVLGQLQLDKFHIKQGSFSIINTHADNPRPLTISGIDFTIKGLNIKADENPSYDPLAVTDSIGLAIAGQKIIFPDAQKSVSFKAFRFNSFTGSITLDSFQVTSQSDTTENNFNVFADKLSLKKFKLTSREGSDFTQIDSVFFTKPTVKLILETGNAKKDTVASVSATMRKVVETITGNGAINYIGINNVNFNITTLKNDKQSNFVFVQDKLEIGDVLLNKDSITPISISSLRFGLKRYVNYFDDSTYLIQFDSVKILNGQLALYDFQFESTPKAPQLQRVHIPVLLLSQIDWFRLIFAKQFAAKSIALYDPQITVTANGSGGAGNGNGLAKIKELFAVEHILLQNANIKVIFSKNEYAQIRRLSIDAAPIPFLQAPTATSLLAMLQTVNVQDISLIKSGWNVKASGIKISDTGGVRLPFFSVANNQKNIHAKGENLRVSRLMVDESKNAISLGKVSWKNLYADIILPEQKDAKPEAKKPNLFISEVQGGPVKINVSKDDLKAFADIRSLNTDRITIHAGKLDTLKKILLEGNEWKVETSRLNASGKTFIIAQQRPSGFDKIQFNIKSATQTINTIIPEISFAADIEKLIQNQLVLTNFSINRPEVKVIINESGAAVTANNNANTAKAFPYIRLQKFQILKPDISVLKISQNDTTQMHMADASFSAGIVSDGNELSLQQISLQLATFQFGKGDSLQVGLKGGSANLTAASFSLYKNTDDRWKLTDAALQLKNASLTSLRDSGRADTVVVPSFNVAHFSASQHAINNWRSLVFNQPQMQLKNVSVRYYNASNIFMVEDLNTVIGSNKISMASFLYHPQLGEEAFIKAHYYETDFIRAKTGALEIYDFDRQKFIRDSMIDIRHISISDIDFRDTRDKTPPFKAGVIKPLPITLINKIPLATNIDSLTLHNTHVTYKEVSEKTGNPGTIYFSNVESKFLILKNRNQTIRDTFQWKATALMMDSMPFFLGIKAAYRDSLDKLYLTVKLRPTNLSYLNPFFAPLESISFKNGVLDTLGLNVVANDYIGHGTMKFFYHDLHIDFLSKSDTAKKGFFKSLLTFVANKLVIKSKNDSRVGAVYFERIRDRSIFNYIVKLVLSGMKTNIGAQKNKKVEKAYQQKLKEMNWQPLEN